MKDYSKEAIVTLPVDSLITLEGSDVFQAQVVRGGQTKLDKNNDPFYTMALASMGFIVREDVKQAYDNGQLAQLRLVRTEQESPVKDAEGNDTAVMEKIPALSYSGHTLYSQLIGVAENEGKLIGIKAKYAALSAQLKPADIAEIANVNAEEVLA